MNLRPIESEMVLWRSAELPNFWIFTRDCVVLALGSDDGPERNGMFRGLSYSVRNIHPNVKSSSCSQQLCIAFKVVIHKVLQI